MHRFIVVVVACGPACASGEGGEARDSSDTAPRTDTGTEESCPAQDLAAGVAGLEGTLGAAAYESLLFAQANWQPDAALWSVVGPVNGDGALTDVGVCGDGESIRLYARFVSGNSPDEIFTTCGLDGIVGSAAETRESWNPDGAALTNWCYDSDDIMARAISAGYTPEGVVIPAVSPVRAPGIDGYVGTGNYDFLADVPEAHALMELAYQREGGGTNSVSVFDATTGELLSSDTLADE